MRKGARLGIDVGSVRIGVAVSDHDGLVAAAVETVSRDTRGVSDLDRIATIAAERQVIEVIVGLPRSLSGHEGEAAGAVRRYAERLADRVAPVVVRLMDERLTTVSARRGLREMRVSTRKERSVVDQAAAVIILQTALDTERGTGEPPGEQLRIDAP